MLGSLMVLIWHVGGADEGGGRWTCASRRHDAEIAAHGRFAATNGDVPEPVLLARSGHVR